MTMQAYIMDGRIVLSKLSVLIELISTLADKADTNGKFCQIVAGATQFLSALIIEVQESNVSYVGGAITSFEGLEHAFLKAKVLIMKCCGQSSRVYMVLKKFEVAEKFKHITMEIESHVNSLPLGVLQLTDSTQEQVSRCISELQNARYDVEEEGLILKAKMALKYIKDGVELTQGMLRDLAKGFCLVSNHDVLREITFLEKEKEAARNERNGPEEEFISQLLKLVTEIGDDLADQNQIQLQFGGLPVPADFCCPLSLELMSDPVIVASGQTYERGHIQKWLDDGNTTCPKTRQILSHKNLIPNYTVKALIANWCEVNNVPYPEQVKLNSSQGNMRASVLFDSNSGSSESAEHPHRNVTILPILQEGQMTHMKAFRNISPVFADAKGEVKALQQNISFQSQNFKCGPRLLSPSISNEGSFNDSNSLNIHSRSISSSGVSSSADETLFISPFDESTAETSQQPSSNAPLQIHAMQKDPAFTPRELGFSVISNLNRLTLSSSNLLRSSVVVLTNISKPVVMDDAEQNMRNDVSQLVDDLKSGSADAQRVAATSLRFLAKQSPENRKLIARCGAIMPLVMLLNTLEPQTQENAVTALLNLSMDDKNKSEIALAGAIDPLVKILKTGTTEAKENAAATLYSLSVLDENKVAIGESGAIPFLVDLLMYGSLQGKKDAATALYNLSILHANKARIVGAGAVRPLVELMGCPAAGMVDKAVTVLANLATIQEGRSAIWEDGGIPALVEVVELGSQCGKENAAAALLCFCTDSHKFRAMVFQEGAIPPLVALSQSGTTRAKEKASTILRHFREQQRALLGRRVRENIVNHF
ncbi:hypothetical protein KP509_02G076900 [Ceratopteris richardii]|uniref:RING-type E3 ubiquitin transferase n=1 Tax=Ceratopteris richardii TaxID=49495 RepID=A0A8T2VFM5_CERRI|nr:hypothetical protein KP509_02G076900 [Ceratopteris richardii]